MMTFKQSNGLTAAAGALLVMLAGAAPDSSFATRIPGLYITGEVTSMPGSGRIEVDHKTYKIKAGTTADRTLRNFHMGQVVDIELDGPTATATSEVVIIAAHIAR